MISSELERFLYKAYRIDGANHIGRCEPHRQVRSARADNKKTKVTSPSPPQRGGTVATQRRTKNEQRTNKRRTKDEQKTNKRRTKDEQKTNK